MIAKCIGCKAHEYQDGKYGAKFRVLNANEKKGEATCTVCGKVHPMPSLKKEEKK